MKKSTIIIGSILLIVILCVITYTITTTKKSSVYFNEVVLDSSNVILNNMEPYLDTIISVGLKELDLSNIKVVVFFLPKEDKDKYMEEQGVDIKAHVQSRVGYYAIWMDVMDRKDAISALSHELIHIKQYHSGRLSVVGGVPKWLGQDVGELKYDYRPWEIEAFYLMGVLEEKITNTLYK